MADYVHARSECIRPKLATCGVPEVIKLAIEFNQVIVNSSDTCYMNFTEELIKGSHSSRCIMPLCSHDNAMECIGSLQTGQAGSCGYVVC